MKIIQFTKKVQFANGQTITNIAHPLINGNAHDFTEAQCKVTRDFSHDKLLSVELILFPDDNYIVGAYLSNGTKLF